MLTTACIAFNSKVKNIFGYSTHHWEAISLNIIMGFCYADSDCLQHETETETACSFFAYLKSMPKQYQAEKIAQNIHHYIKHIINS